MSNKGKNLLNNTFSMYSPTLSKLLSSSCFYNHLRNGWVLSLCGIMSHMVWLPTTTRMYYDNQFCSTTFSIPQPQFLNSVLLHGSSVCVCVCAFVCTHIWGPEVNLVCYSTDAAYCGSPSPPPPQKQCLSLGLKTLARLVGGSWPPGPTVSLPPQHWMLGLWTHVTISNLKDI